MNMTPVAQAVQRQGRGRDTMLVHMTPKEVGGLQALAMQHGGSLTINPQTGLPEAGFLEAILPTLAGAALTIGSGGVINPYMSAAIVGGIQTARTGDVGQGLLAGLGAFGGAGIGAGLTAAGAGAASWHCCWNRLLLPLRLRLDGCDCSSRNCCCHWWRSRCRCCCSSCNGATALCTSYTAGTITKGSTRCTSCTCKHRPSCHSPCF
jgi:hypothetical protein